MKKLTFLFVVFCCHQALSQKQFNKDIGYKVDDSTETDYGLISPESFKKVVKSSFGQLATGQSTAGVLSNFAALDIAQGKFSFNGSLPLGSRLFITAALSGDIDNNISQLFSNFKLNNNTSIDLRFHVRIPHGTTFFYKPEDATKMRSEIWKVNNKYLIDSFQISSDSGIAHINLRLDSLVKDSLKQRLDVLKDATSNSNFLAINKDVDAITRNAKTNSYKNQLKELLETEKLYLEVSRRFDSLQHAIDHKAEYYKSLLTIAAKKKKADIESLELNADWSAVRMQWLSLRISPLRSKFYMLDTTEEFTRQIFDTALTTAYFGLEYSFYFYSRRRAQTHYFNLGLGFTHTDNRKELDTYDATDSWKRDSGRNSHTYATKVNAYNGKLIESKSWKFYSNYYFFLSKNVVGFHLFPDVEKKKDVDLQFNIGAGLVFSFKKKGEEKTIINAEPYFRLVDMTDVLQTRTRALKRNEIGIRFGLPFTPDGPKKKE